MIMPLIHSTTGQNGRVFSFRKDKQDGRIQTLFVISYRQYRRVNTFKIQRHNRSVSNYFQVVKVHSAVSQVVTYAEYGHRTVSIAIRLLSKEVIK